MRSHSLWGAHHLTRDDPGAEVHAPFAQEHRKRERTACRGPGNAALGHEAAAALLGDEVALLHQRLDRPTDRAAAHTIALAELGLGGNGLSAAPRVGIYLVSKEHLELHVQRTREPAREHIVARVGVKGPRRGKIKALSYHADLSSPQSRQIMYRSD